MAEQLTYDQKMAVENQGGKLLVSAAAGSGKTKVLVDRVMRYLTDPVDPANIDDFLIITYTKAAAAELRGKIASKLSEQLSQNPQNRHLQQQMQRLYLAKISTVHSFCTDILREYAYLLDINADFRVADEDECFEIQWNVLEKLLEIAYETADQNPDFCAFIDTQGFGRDDRQVPLIIQKVYSRARCHLNPEKWLQDCLYAADAESLLDAAETIWGEYLITDLRKFLALQIETLSKCASLAENSPGMEKPAAILYGTVDQLQVLSACEKWDDFAENCNIDFGRLVFSKKCTDTLLAEQIKAIRNSCKDELAKKIRVFQSSNAQILNDLRHSKQVYSGLISLVKAYGDLYTQQKKHRHILDFGDLEHKTLDLLLGKNRSTPTKLAVEIGSRFREIMVDEYQDSNEVQDKIFSALTEKRNNCFMVGDVKQSIYQFRLADPEIFIEKYNAYEKAETAEFGAGRKIMLSNNFRSSSGVISAVNDVFSVCMSETVGGIQYGNDEMLHEGIPHIALNEPEVELYGITVQEDAYAEEAAFVTERIQTLLDGTHYVRDGEHLRVITPDDIVILLRSPGSVGSEFVLALEQKGIACTTGGGFDLLQAEEISVLRSLLQVISNPLQDIPLIAVMASRVFAFHADELAEIRANHLGIPFYIALQKSQQSKACAFLETLYTLRNESRLYSVSRLIQRIFTLTSMDSIYDAMPDGDMRRENLFQFTQVAAAFEATGRKNLDQFLWYLESIDEKGLILPEAQRVSGAVTIMSIHKSKGLEFPVVFLCGLSRRFNMESAREAVLCDKDLGLGVSNVDHKTRIKYPGIAKRAITAKMMSETLSEELRVLYVAMTRPKDRLIMTYASKNLKAELEDISMRMNHSRKELMTCTVTCPGEWVLLSALMRTEAGAFLKLCDNFGAATVREHPWLIRVVEGSISSSRCIEIGDNREVVQKATIEQIRTSLNFVYPHTASVHAPSKITATQLKGRFKDNESAEQAAQNSSYNRAFPKPGFALKRTTGKARGNSVHTVMQYINFDNCDSLNGVELELARLVQENRITAEEREMVEAEKIFAFFSSDIGEKVRTAKNLVREFKFSIMDSCSKYIPATGDDQVLLQGVVDCAVIEPDGITVIDFKTDKVTEQTAQTCAEQYRNQIEIYASALSRIFEKPITAKLIFFYQIGTFLSL